MEREELIVQIMLKPNCGLENTRASLVVRRITPLCDTISCHPRTVKSDRSTIEYLRDHGLFIRFHSSMPEQVILAIKGAFFVDSCTLIEDQDAIPPFDTPTQADGVEKNSDAFELPSTFAKQDEADTRMNELTKLLARFDEVHRSLRTHAERIPHDSELNSIVFTHAQAVDDLRTTIARSRIEPFDRIAPSLRTLVADYSRRFGTQVDLDIIDGHMALDRSVLASMEEVIKHVIRSCIRDGIERPEARIACSKPPRASLCLRLESDGSEAICRIEHDGCLFDADAIGRQAAKRGLLTRPLEDYTEDEIGSLLLLPGFAPGGTDSVNRAFSLFNEIGSMLQHAGARGEVRNTKRDTIEISLYFPVPFTVMEAALLQVGDASFALPAQQIERFETFDTDRIQTMDVTSAGAGDLHVSRRCYVSEDGKPYELLNGQKAPSPLDAKRPAFVILLEVLDKKRSLIVDEVDGYERISVNRLPALLDRRAMRKAGCFGYAVLESGQPCVVLSIRRLLNATPEKEADHA